MTYLTGLPVGRYFCQAVVNAKGDRSELTGSLFTTSVLMLSRITILMVLFLAVGAVNAATVVLDGDLSDLIIASTSPATGASSSESGADAENNGFDITNMYSSFSSGEDAFYLGFETTGTIGDACNPSGGSAFSTCAFLGDQNGGTGVFDLDESLGFQLKFGDTDFALAGAVVVQQILTGDGIADNGPGNENNVVQTAPGSVTVNWAVSEANDGIEFAIYGLLANGILSPLSAANPQEFAVRFSAGSADNDLPEDQAFLSGVLVPVPAAAWLFGSSLLGLLGLQRRKQRL